MPVCTLNTTEISYLYVYTLNCAVFMLAAVPLCPEVWHFDLSQHASVSSGAGFDNPKGRNSVGFQFVDVEGCQSKAALHRDVQILRQENCWDNPRVTAPSSDRGAFALGFPKAVLWCPVEAETSSALLMGGGGAPRSALSYEGRLRESTLEKRRLSRDFTEPLSTLGGLQERWRRTVNKCSSVRTKGNGFGLKKGRFRFRY